jgi:hypothetical protein
MTNERPDFSGPYGDELAELAGVIDWLWAEHDKSFVKAGDDKVYAFGGGGYVIVLDERVWNGLIELMTPAASLQFKPGDDGKIAVVSADQDPSKIKAVIRDGAAGLKKYYETRYWSTPKTAAR